MKYTLTNREFRMILYAYIEYQRRMPVADEDAYRCVSRYDAYKRPSGEKYNISHYGFALARRNKNYVPHSFRIIYPGKHQISFGYLVKNTWCHRDDTAVVESFVYYNKRHRIVAGTGILEGCRRELAEYERACVLGLAEESDEQPRKLIREWNRCSNAESIRKREWYKNDYYPESGNVVNYVSIMENPLIHYVYSGVWPDWYPIGHW